MGDDKGILENSFRKSKNAFKKLFSEFKNYILKKIFQKIKNTF